jgi:acetyl-CoA acetyltransferase
MTFIVGIGETEYSRNSHRSVPSLAVSATQAALRDAELEPSSIDGIITLGGSLFAEDVVTPLAMSLRILDATPAPGGNSAVSALGLADALISSGRVETVLIVLARNAASANRIDQRVAGLPGPQFRQELEQPQGWSTPAQWYAMICRRHMFEFGTTKKQMATVALLANQAAQLNPRAMRYGSALTEAMYFDAPMIADPYQLYDCCLETDGAAAVVVSRSRRRTNRSVGLLAAESSRPESPDDLTNRRDWYQVGLSTAAPAAYERAGLGPGDIDAAMIYDCFTFEVIHQLEVGGFCGVGEGGPFVESGAIAPTGALPINPHGGLLAEGHLGGLNHVIEAVRQLRGEAGARQLSSPRHVAVTGWGDWGDGSMAILDGPS